MISKRGVPAVVLALLIGTAACSSSSGKGGSSSAKADPAADLAVARAAVLKKTDLPDYKSAPHSESGDIPPALKKQFATCMGVATTVFDDTPGAQKADSPDFSKGAEAQQQVSNNVEIDPTTADIDNGWKVLSDPRAEGCLEKLFDSLIKQEGGGNNVKFGNAKVSRFEVGVGDRSLGYALVMSATVPGQIIELDIDVIYAARDRAGMEFDFFNLGTTPDRAFEKSLVQKVYDRVGDKTA